MLKSYFLMKKDMTFFFDMRNIAPANKFERQYTKYVQLRGEYVESYVQKRPSTATRSSLRAPTLYQNNVQADNMNKLCMFKKFGSHLVISPILQKI